VLVLDCKTGLKTWWVADVIIAADGIRSTLRKQIAQAIGFQDEPVPTGDAAYRLLIPREKVKYNPTLLEMLDQNVAMRYMGPHGHVMAYPLRGNTLYNLVLLHPDKNADRVKDDDYWTTQGDRAEMLAFYSSWSPAIRAWISHADEKVLDWSLNTHKPLPTWVHGNIALAGDACHPMLPYVAQGAANGIEDAAALATVFTHTDDISVALSIYQTVRKERAERIAASASATGRNLHLPDGPEQQRRDERIIHPSGNGRSRDRWRDTKWQDYMWQTDVMRDIDESWDEMVAVATKVRSTL
jgi:salicylate hydroxylase